MNPRGVVAPASRGTKCGRPGSASRPGSRSDKLRVEGGAPFKCPALNVSQNHLSNHPFHIEEKYLSMKYFGAFTTNGETANREAEFRIAILVSLFMISLRTISKPLSTGSMPSHISEGSYTTNAYLIVIR